MWRKLLQSARWMATPLPRVTKPPIASGGAGRQQRASVVSSDSTPTTSTPPRPPPAALRGRLQRDRVVGAARGSAGRSRFSMLRSENSSLPTTSNSASALLEAQLLGQVVQLQRGAAFALQQLLHRLAAARDGRRSAPAR